MRPFRPRQTFRLNRRRLFVSFALAAGLVAGCASYRPEPLPAAPSMARDVAQIEVDASRMPLPRLRSHRFDPSDGLDIDEVAMLAVDVIFAGHLS